MTTPTQPEHEDAHLEAAYEDRFGADVEVEVYSDIDNQPYWFGDEYEF